jgi:phosphoglycerate-specific signal transduction histidine kinase
MSKKLLHAESRLVLALDAAAPTETIDLLRRRVQEAGGDPNSVIPVNAGDVTPPSNPLPRPLTEQDRDIIRMVGELRRRRQKVQELRAEQKQVEADLVEIEGELAEAEAELGAFVEKAMNRRQNVTEPLDAA